MNLLKMSIARRFGDAQDNINKIKNSGLNNKAELLRNQSHMHLLQNIELKVNGNIE